MSRSFVFHALAILLSTLFLLVETANAQVSDSANMTTIVSRRVPVSAPLSLQKSVGVSRSLSQFHAAANGKAPLPAGSSFWHWKLISQLPSPAVIQDLLFTSADVGYAAAELGFVFKTSDGGRQWTPVLLSDSSDYWYGIDAISDKDIVVTGFHDGLDPVTKAQVNQALVRWSNDAGVSWWNPIVLGDEQWAFRGRFPDHVHGVVFGENLHLTDTPAYVTADGGALFTDWSRVVTGNSGWFGQQFSAHANGRVRASGIDYCSSADFGATWNCGPQIDPVFDGETFFLDELNGWVASGSIAPIDEGWVHKTSDGGATWSDRTLEAPWPIRTLLFIDPVVGWAAGGDFGVDGGIYSSKDGGNSWSLDVDTGAEMRACSKSGFMIYCAGFDAAFNGKIYALNLDQVFSDGFDPQ